MNSFHCCSLVVCIFSKVALSLSPKVLVNAKDFYPEYSQKQQSVGVLIKRCSENKFTGKLMMKCDFNKVAKQLYLNCTSAWVFSSKFDAYFQNAFS